MARLNVLLLCLAIACALGVVTSQHKARKLFVELQKEQELARQMEVEWGQLQLEQSTWANPARVDTLARSRIGLISPPQERIHVETLQADARGVVP